MEDRLSTFVFVLRDHTDNRLSGCTTARLTAKTLAKFYELEYLVAVALSALFLDSFPLLFLIAEVFASAISQELNAI